MTMATPAGLEVVNKRERKKKGAIPDRETDRLRVSRFHALIMDSARHKMVGIFFGVRLFLGSGVSGVDFILYGEKSPWVGKKERCHRQAGRGNEDKSTNSSAPALSCKEPPSGLRECSRDTQHPMRPEAVHMWLHRYAVKLGPVRECDTGAVGALSQPKSLTSSVGCVDA